MIDEAFVAQSRARNEERYPVLKEVKTHPALDVFPLMREHEFMRLVWSIKKIGLIHPILQDETGRIIDGRCRFLACSIADVEPKLAPPKDPVAAYLFAANVARRHLNLGQQAMITVLIEKGVEEGGIPDDGFIDQIMSLNLVRRHLGYGALVMLDARVDEPDYPASLVSDEARLIGRYADLTKSVSDYGMPLAEAYEKAREKEREAARQAAERQRLEQLRGEAPFVAAMVDEGTLTLDQGLARAEEIAAAPMVAEHLQVIRSRGRRMIEDAIEIGARLTECRRLIRRDWIGWLDRELGFSDRSALDFMRVHHLALTRSENFSDLSLPVSGLYLLARPSTSEAIRDDILGRAAAGEAISFAEIRREVSGEMMAATPLSGLAKAAARLVEERPDDPLAHELQALVARMASHE